MAYNPNQPRVPAGNKDGGQWTSGDVARALVDGRHVTVRLLDVDSDPTTRVWAVDMNNPDRDYMLERKQLIRHIRKAAKK